MFDDNGNFLGIALLVVAVILIAAVASLIVAFPFRWWWNWLMPNIFGLPEITYWEAWGLSVFLGILFGGMKSKSD